MIKKDTKEKRGFTLRLSDKTHEMIEKKSSELGISKNAYISMILHKTLKKK